MKTIRTNCFETNSSSTHSITIDTTSAGKRIDPKGYIVKSGEFGWEWISFNDFASKASYFWTLVINSRESEEMNALKVRMTNLANEHGFSLVETDIGYNYVDHGWEHYQKFMKEHPQLLTEAGLFDFLVDSSCWIMLGNDNECSPPDFYLSPHQIENAPKYLTLDADPAFRYAMVGEMTEDYWAAEAAYAWYEKNNRPSYGETGWMKILSAADGKIEVNIEKYNHAEKKSDILDTYTLAYTIEYNEKHIAPSL